MTQNIAVGRPVVAVVLIIACIALAATAAPASEHETWIVTRVEGDASHGAGDGAWRVALSGDRLPAGRHVRTGADGRLAIIGGPDRIDAGPDARFVVLGEPGAQREGILQRLGRLLFEIGDRESGNFTVDTPLLAVVIKGTRFSVAVSVESVVVSVEEGLVEVRAKRSGEAALVEPGFTAKVTAATGALDVRSTKSLSDPDEATESDSSLTDTVGDTAGSLGDAVGGVGDSVGGAVGGVGDSVGGAVGGAAGSVGDAVGGAAGSVGDAVGGLGL